MVESKIEWEIEDEVINAVIAAAVYSEDRRPGIWQDMIKALSQGASKTEEGTTSAFLFRAMVDRLREEFRTLN